MQSNIHSSLGPSSSHRIVLGAFVLMTLGMVFALPASGLTLRSKSDLRLWETVTDRSDRLAWSWAPNADTVCLTFSNMLTHAVTSETVVRTTDARRGDCSLPVVPASDETLIAATLVQLAGGVEIACETAELAFVIGTGSAVSRPMTVRTKDEREWWRIRNPQLSAFDARWWGFDAPSGYEVLWVAPPGWHRVTRAFEDVGVVDVALLRFGLTGIFLLVR